MNSWHLRIAEEKGERYKVMNKIAKIDKTDQKRIAIVLICAVLVFCTWLVRSTGKGVITGEVYLKEGGASLAGEEVKIYKGSDAYGSYKTVVTNRKGTYKASLPAGKYTIAVEDDDYDIDSEQTVTLKSHKTVRCRDIIGDKTGYEA